MDYIQEIQETGKLLFNYPSDFIAALSLALDNIRVNHLKEKRIRV
jgi:hypothetical protein